MKRDLWVVILVLVAAAAVVRLSPRPPLPSQSPSAPATTDYAAQEVRILEGFLRKAIADQMAFGEKRPKHPPPQAFFIQVYGKDPDPRLIANLADIKPPVKPISACLKTPDRSPYFRDPETNGPGWIFHIDGVRHETTSRVEVNARFDHPTNGWGSGWMQPMVETADGTWVDPVTLKRP